MPSHDQQTDLWIAKQNHHVIFPSGVGHSKGGLGETRQLSSAATYYEPRLRVTAVSIYV